MPPYSSGMARAGQSRATMEPQSFSGGLAGLDDGAHDVDGALLLEERADRGTQLFLLTRELELHRTPFPASPVASPIPSRDRAGGRSGRVYLTPMSASGACATFTPPRFLGRTWLGVPLGGRRSVAQARAGDAGASVAAGSAARPSRTTRGRSPTLCGAPLAQRQSNGLLIRRFRVRIPRGARSGLARTGARIPGLCVPPAFWAGRTQAAQAHSLRLNCDAHSCDARLNFSSAAYIGWP